MKTCTTCKTELSKDQFHVERKSKDGLRSQCKKCCSFKKKQKYAANPEKVKIAVSLYVEKNHAKVTEYKKEWYQKNRQKIRERHAEHYKRNSDHIKEKVQDWKESNLEKVKLIQRSSQARRRAIFRKADGKHNASDIAKLLVLQRWKCASCFVDLKNGYHVDHIQPLSKGGANWPNNLQCLCPKCNRKKHNKDPIKWANENGKLL